MAALDRCLASMARLTLTQPARPAISSIPRFLAPATASMQTRHASVVRITKKPKKKAPKDFKRPNFGKREFPRYSLLEAMRILRATEVGQPPGSTKYEVHINFKTPRNGPVIRGKVRLPHSIGTDHRIAVVCPEDSELAKEALASGAVAAGEETIFQAVRNNEINFDRLLCHEDSFNKLKKAGLHMILGPKKLMPSYKAKTIVINVSRAMKEMAGAVEFREREGMIHSPVGKLNFTPDQLKANLSMLMKQVKAGIAELSDEVPKEINEVVISSTHGPGISLSGKLEPAESEMKIADYATQM